MMTSGSRAFECGIINVPVISVLLVLWSDLHMHVLQEELDDLSTVRIQPMVSRGYFSIALLTKLMLPTVRK